MNEHQRIHLEELTRRFLRDHEAGSGGPNRDPKHFKLGRRSMVALSVLGCLLVYLLIAF